MKKQEGTHNTRQESKDSIEFIIFSIDNRWLDDIVTGLPLTLAGSGNANICIFNNFPSRIFLVSVLLLPIALYLSQFISFPSQTVPQNPLSFTSFSNPTPLHHHHHHKTHLSLSLSLSLFVFLFSITHFSLTSFKNWILCKMSDGYEKYSFAGAVSISIAAGQAETTRFPINPYYMNLWWCSILIWWCSTLIIPLGIFPINPWKSFYCH